jgi:hypothetical protein
MALAGVLGMVLLLLLEASKAGVARFMLRPMNALPANTAAMA